MFAKFTSSQLNYIYAASEVVSGLKKKGGAGTEREFTVYCTVMFISKSVCNQSKFR